jgi:response regulator of citrate/malate metabolism
MVKRGDIKTATLEKIKEFLKKQDKPVSINEIIRKTGVNFYSLQFALTMIVHQKNKEGQISVRKR